MSEAIESKEFELQAFRDEIKKLKETNDSLRLGVENVGDLGAEEAALWDEFKKLLKLVDVELKKCQNIEDVQNSNELKNLLKSLKDLESSSKDNLRHEDVLKNNSRKEFFAWFNNRLVLTSSISILFPEDFEYDEESKEEDFVKAKELVDRKITEFCS